MKSSLTLRATVTYFAGLVLCAALLFVASPGRAQIWIVEVLPQQPALSPVGEVPLSVPVPVRVSFKSVRGNHASPPDTDIPVAAYIFRTCDYVMVYADTVILPSFPYGTEKTVRFKDFTPTWAGDYGVSGGKTMIDSIEGGPNGRVIHPTDGSSSLTPFVVTMTGTNPNPLIASVILDPPSVDSANHELFYVGASFALEGGSPLCDLKEVKLLSVTSNEPDSGLSSDDVPGDIQGAIIGEDTRIVELRAESSRTGTGRVYTLTYSITVVDGRSTTVSGTVTVPRDATAGVDGTLGEVASTPSLTTYPNPASQATVVNISGALVPPMAIDVIDERGVKMFAVNKFTRGKDGAYSAELLTSQLANGTYLLRVKNSSASARLVVKR